MSCYIEVPRQLAPAELLEALATAATPAERAAAHAALTAFYDSVGYERSVVLPETEARGHEALKQFQYHCEQAALQVVAPIAPAVTNAPITETE